MTPSGACSKKALKPVGRHEAVGWLIEEENLPAARACGIMGLSRPGWYRSPSDSSGRDAHVIARLNEVVGKHGRRGFRKCYHWLRQHDEGWNYKRVLRVYRSMGLNLPRRTRRRLPARVREPLSVPVMTGRMWSMDFMHDTLYCGKRFRTLNIIDEGVREALAIEVDASMPALRVIRVPEQLKDSDPLPEQIRLDNGPELISA